MKRAFDGRRMALILVTGFAVVIAVNFYAAFVASRTFGGVVVENSYVASQKYNDWLEQAEAERALGWTARARRLSDGRIAVTLDGVPAGAIIEGAARHPLGRQPDQRLRFDSSHVSVDPLPSGRWTLRIAVRADGKLFRSESDIR